MEIEAKLDVLADAAKYDASCASSGAAVRKAPKRGMGSTTPSGICHSWSDDGRCISLLKVLMSNACIYDCAYCVNRCSNDVPRATFTPEEVADLTINFYKRNYIEGLFLSSGVLKSPDFTMERMCRVVQILRQQFRFGGYIHLKVVPGASPDLLDWAGRYADRVSVNIELPSGESLHQLAPQKKKDDIIKPMGYMHDNILVSAEERKKSRKAPVFAPAGQSTQLIVGATPESDYQIVHLSAALYKKMKLKRVYYSAYIPVNDGSNLPAIRKPPMLREHRLYQADWLLRFYQFDAKEIIDPAHPFLDDKFDPKMNWALNHLDFFPVEVNTADYWQLLRVPGIGMRSAQRIIDARRWSKLDHEGLKKIGVVLKRARYFITCKGFYRAPNRSFTSESLRTSILYDSGVKNINQLLLF